MFPHKIWLSNIKITYCLLTNWLIDKENISYPVLDSLTLDQEPGSPWGPDNITLASSSSSWPESALFVTHADGFQKPSRLIPDISMTSRGVCVRAWWRPAAKVTHVHARTQSQCVYCMSVCDLWPSSSSVLKKERGRTEKRQKTSHEKLLAQTGSNLGSNCCPSLAHRLESEENVSIF